MPLRRRAARASRRSKVDGLLVGTRVPHELVRQRLLSSASRLHPLLPLEPGPSPAQSSPRPRGPHRPRCPRSRGLRRRRRDPQCLRRRAPLRRCRDRWSDSWGSSNRGPAARCTNDAANGFPVVGGTAVGLTPGGGLAGRPPDGTPAPPPNNTNGQRFRVGPFPHGFGQTTPRMALPALGGRWPGSWMCSRVGHSLHPLNGTPCRPNGQRFRVGLFRHGFWPPMPRAAGRGNHVPRPRPLCPGGRPLEDEIVLALNPA